MSNDKLLVEHGEITLDLNNLELNKIYKNWKCVCEALNVDYGRYKGGRNKKLLFNKINTLVELGNTKKAHNYKFIQYKTPPLISMHNMKNKNKIVKLALINNIAKYVQANPNDYSKTIVFSWNEMLHSLGIVNRKYTNYYNDHEGLADKLDINTFVADEFYNTSKNTLRRAVTTALNSLVKDGALIWHKSFKITYQLKSEQDKFDKKIYTRIANDAEIKLVLEAGDKAYEEIYDKFVSKPQDNTKYKSDDKIKKARDYLFATDRHNLFYDTRNRIMTKLWDRNDIVVTGIYNVIKIIENMYRFKKYGDILDNYDFNPYDASGVMQNVLMKNTNKRKENAAKLIANETKKNPFAVKSTGKINYNALKATTEVKDMHINRIDDNFEDNFWRTVKYCMDDAYDAEYVIKKLNL